MIEKNVRDLLGHRGRQRQRDRENFLLLRFDDADVSALVLFPFADNVEIRIVVQDGDRLRQDPRLRLLLG